MIRRQTCMESKKKNMMRRETEAPRGRHIACTLSRVVTLFSRLNKEINIMDWIV